ncbi:hypothetical protein SODG_007234 [Sodalis praecaptivus]|nr:hypothetical protein NVIRENTERO_03770 [Sodalis praecaptivus]
MQVALCLIVQNSLEQSSNNGYSCLPASVLTE